MRLCSIAVIVAVLLASSKVHGTSTSRIVKVLSGQVGNRPVIPPQLLLKLSGEEAPSATRILEILRGEQAQRMLERLSLGNHSPLTQQLQQHLQQLLQQLQNDQLASFKALLRQNLWEAMSITSFTYALGDNLRFYLDPQYGMDTLISSARYNSIAGFSIITPQQQRHLDFSEVMELDAEQDFFMLQSFPAPIFTPRHYIFHGEHYVYALDRETLKLEYSGQAETVIDEGVTLLHKIRQIEAINDELFAVRYHKAGRHNQTQEIVQLVTLDGFNTIYARNVKGELRAVAPNGTLLAVSRGKHLVVIDTSSGKAQTLHRGTSTHMRFADDSRHLASIDGDTLVINDLSSTALSMPRQVKLTAAGTLISATPTYSELLWDEHDIFVAHRADLRRVDRQGKVLWTAKLPENTHALQFIGEQHLAVFSKQQVYLHSKESGELLLRLTVDAKQHIVDQTFTDRYLALLLEDRLHSAEFRLTLARIPFAQLQEFIAQSPLLQRIAATEGFTLQKAYTRFAELVLSAVEQHLQHHLQQIDSAELVQLLLILQRTYHLVPGAYYVFPQITAVLTQRAEEIARLTEAEPRLAALLQHSFL